MSILITQRVRFDHVGWTIGFCAHCRQLEALRIEVMTEVTSLYLVPIVRAPCGQALRCDFCERFEVLPASQLEVLEAEWSPQQGIPALAKRVGHEEELLHQNNDEQRLRSLLSAAQGAAAVNEMDIGFGLITGAILGAALGFPLGLFLYQRQLIQTQLDQFGFVALTLLIATVGGGVLGAAVQAMLGRGKVVRQKLARACQNYRIDMHKLEQLSHEYGGAVRRSVQSLELGNG